MEKKKIIIISIAIVICCWIFNIGYFYMNKLKGPVFIENYKEIEVREELPSKEELAEHEKYSFFEGLSKEEKIKQLTKVDCDDFYLFYLKSNGDDDDVDQIVFPELDNIIVDVRPEVATTYNNYSLMSIHIANDMLNSSRFQHSIIEEIRKGKNVVTKIRCHTRSGKKYDVNLGEIYFTEPTKSTEDEPFVGREITYDKKDRNCISYHVNRDFYVTSVNSNIKNELGDVRLNSIDINKLDFPYKIKKDTSFAKEDSFIIDYTEKDNSYKSLQGVIRVNVECGEIKRQIPIEFRKNENGFTIELNSKFIKAIKEGGGQAHEVGTK